MRGDGIVAGVDVGCCMSRSQKEVGEEKELGVEGIFNS